MKRALIVYGGWEGHDPEPVSKIFEQYFARRRL